MQIRSVLAVCAALIVATVASEARSQGGSYGGGIIAPGSPPLTLAGRSGGGRQARSMGSSCRGTIAVRPDHVIRVTSPMQVRFEVLNAGGDTTFVIVGPSGVMCDDDSGNGVNPRIIRQLMPGVYRVFVGTYGGRNFFPYTIQVQGMGMPMPQPMPQPMPMPGGARFGGAVVGPGNMTAVLSGTSGGPIPARNYGSSCRGHITAMPSHTINVLSPMMLTFDVTASGDTTLTIIGPAGTLCDDDGGAGSNPRIMRPLNPGTYQVYVGSYSRGRTYPYTLHVHP